MVKPAPGLQQRLRGRRRRADRAPRGAANRPASAGIALERVIGRSAQTRRSGRAARRAAGHVGAHGQHRSPGRARVGEHRQRALAAAVEDRRRGRAAAGCAPGVWLAPDRVELVPARRPDSRSGSPSTSIGAGAHGRAWRSTSRGSTAPFQTLRSSRKVASTRLVRRRRRAARRSRTPPRGPARRRS